MSVVTRHLAFFIDCWDSLAYGSFHCVGNGSSSCQIQLEIWNIYGILIYLKLIFKFFLNQWTHCTIYARLWYKSVTVGEDVFRHGKLTQTASSGQFWCRCIGRNSKKESENWLVFWRCVVLLLEKTLVLRYKSWSCCIFTEHLKFQSWKTYEMPVKPGRLSWMARKILKRYCFNGQAIMAIQGSQKLKHMCSTCWNLIKIWNDFVSVAMVVQNFAFG